MTIMADTKLHGHDFEQIFMEAQHRWLRPAEICEILQNHKMFHISAEPSIMPPSGSLFLFDRKALRYFRKDGHHWRKKKDGKTVKEAHERLKHGSVDVLHCYYAHGEENENFQRRSYWMLEEELSNIVLVHYLEVKGSRAYFNHAKENQRASGDMLTNDLNSAASCSNHKYDSHMHSQTTDTSLYGGQASEFEDAESVYNNQASSSFSSFHEPKQHATDVIHTQLATDVPYAGYSDHYRPMQDSNLDQRKLPVMSVPDSSPTTKVKGIDANVAGLVCEQPKVDSQSWADFFGICDPCFGTLQFKGSCTPTESSSTIDAKAKHEHKVPQQLSGSNLFERQDFNEKWQDYESGLHLVKHSMDQKLGSNSEYDLVYRFNEQKEQPKPIGNNVIVDGKSVYASARKHLLDDSKDGLEKMDSFNRWMSKELGDVNVLADPKSYMCSSSGAYWDSVESQNLVGGVDTSSQKNLDAYVMSPSLSQEQHFSIIDFSPSWTFAGSEVKVLITGKFLRNQQEVENCKWSCMFGELEVPAEVIADGVLRCLTPMHEAGRVPFYVTCSNRLACSEVREFEYKSGYFEDRDEIDNHKNRPVEDFCMRFGNLLYLSSALPNSDASLHDVSHLRCKLSSLLQDNVDDLDHMLRLGAGDDFSPENMKDRLLEKLLKEKLRSWLLQKAAEGGKGPNILDEGGQGVLHLAAALGYDWALEPTIVAGVSVNFRDVNGWTALHWAAFCGREQTVASLIALGAAPGALTHPTPKFPAARTPADLASASGHKGIAGYLAEAALSTQLLSLDLETNGTDGAETCGVDSTQSYDTESMGLEDQPHSSSLPDPLAAVCKASQAAARIYQVFRVQSFQRKQIKELSDDGFKMSDERALSLLAVKTNKQGHGNESVHAAATRIQNKFRSYKGRKDFLMIRRRIVKIQAHVRGYQVRKNYKKIVWCVGIMEKVILRWRRKGVGLRGFRSEALNIAKSDTSSKEDEYDFFKEGRKQTEDRLQKALARVKSMAQYPEARDQYRRLLKSVNEIQETKVAKAIASSEDMVYSDDELIDFDALLDDDTLMPATL